MIVLCFINTKKKRRAPLQCFSYELLCLQVQRTHDAYNVSCDPLGYNSSHFSPLDNYKKCLQPFYIIGVNYSRVPGTKAINPWVTTASECPRHAHLFKPFVVNKLLNRGGRSTTLVVRGTRLFNMYFTSRPARKPSEFEQTSPNCVSSVDRPNQPSLLAAGGCTSFTRMAVVGGAIFPMIHIMNVTRRKIDIVFRL